MIYTDSLPSRTVRVKQQDWLWFSGTAYLGMGHNALYKNYLLEGLTQYGSTFGSSRNNNLRLQVYEEAEQTLAQFVGAPASLSVSSGMLVGQLVMKWLTQQQVAEVWFAPNVHPALWTPQYQPNPSPSQEWFEALPEQLAHSPHSQFIIATDSVGSPQVEQVPLRWIRQLPENKQVTIVIDDSHGLGVFGRHGEGIYAKAVQHLVHPNHQLLVVSSLNKALGTPAGAIFADESTITAIRKMPMFSGASPSVPACMYALMRACQTGIYAHEHQKLLASTQHFMNSVKDLGLFSYFEDYPAFCSLRSGLHEFLKERQILTASFPYPTPDSPPVTRLVVSSLHTIEDLNTLAEACVAFAKVSA
ncbi:MAG: aminotransferase class I/II-fold pyridoxal phosphate-dependent enzyme [Spirosomataceae bacterium]